MHPVSHAPDLEGDEIVSLRRRHTMFEWSAQSKVDPIPVARAEGVYFWTPEGRRCLDFNGQLMCTNVGHSHPKVVRAIQDQAATLAYANPWMPPAAPRPTRTRVHSGSVVGPCDAGICPQPTPLPGRGRSPGRRQCT